MSKGNMLLGYARGKMGDIVFARVNGQQVQRPRNREPKNPRSAAQMYQRSLFACAVSFFSKGRQALFQYAFEGKRSTESDYNAFVRLNAKNGIHMTKNQLDNLSYPKIGNWIMTQGSLPQIVSTFNDEDKKFHCPLVATEAESASTISLGDFSRALIASGNYMRGDILTFVNIRSNAFYEEGSDPDPIVTSEGDAIPWIIEQFILDPSSTEPLTSLLANFDFVVDEGILEVVSRALSSSVDEIGGFCVVHSRRTSSGLKVSTTQLTNSEGVKKALAKCATDEYVEWVLVDWQTSGEAVLEGSLATNEQSNLEVKVALSTFGATDTREGFNLPHTLNTDEYSKAWVLCDLHDAAISVNDISEVVTISGEGISGYTSGTLTFNGGGTATIAKTNEGYLTLTANNGVAIPVLSIVKKK